MEQHNSNEGCYSPYVRVARVRKATFPDGSVETLARFLDVYEGPPLPHYPGVRADVTPEERERRCLVEGERRARRELRWALHCIGADRILTCTFKENLQDIGAARRVWNHFVVLVRARYPKWLFAAVMERQERGALHFHAGVVGFQNVNHLRAYWRRAAGAYGGNINIAVDKRRWGTECEERPVRKIASYLGKYLGKAFGWMPKYSHRFTASHGRARPIIVRWWIEYASDAEIFEVVYRATCGTRAIGVRQWLSADATAYMVRCEGPPVYQECPF
jgi:hypothetical protein